MHLTKNRFYQSIFYILIIFLIIFNGGNYDMYPQFNFVLVGSFFLYCFTDLNYKAHIKKFLFENKKIVLIYIVFLSYLIFQIIPFQQELIKFLSPSKYKILLDLDYNNFSSISLDPSKTYHNLLNYISLILFLIIFKTIFFKERHILNFYYFLVISGFFTSIVAVYFYLIGNPDFLFISNDSYKNSATGFFINRTVFSCFLNLCFLAGLEYLSLIDIIKYKKKDSYFTKIYLRIFLLFITIGIITSFSRIGNFLFLTVIILYLLNQFFLKDKKNIFMFYSLILIIFFDILLFGIYFGGLEIINRFAFLKNELISYSNNNSLILTTNRGDLALFGLHQLKNFLFFGYGSGSFEILFKIFYLNTDIKYANHAHFDFIEFAGELGIIGVAILFFVVFNCCKKINFKNLKNFYLSIFLITILSFDFSFHIYLIQLIFLILFSIEISKKKKINITI
jgi:hypothetical protein